MRAVQIISLGLLASFASALASCASTTESTPTALPGPTALPTQGRCEQHAQATVPLPGTTQADLALSTWLKLLSPKQLEAPIFSPAGAKRFNSVQKQRVDHIHAGHDLLTRMPLREVQALVEERLAYIEKRLRDERYVTGARSRAPDIKAFLVSTLSKAAQTVHLALRHTPLRCGPFRSALHTSDDNHTNRNSCSTVRGQDSVQVLAHHSNGMILVRTRYAMGFLDSADALSPALSRRDTIRIIKAPRAVTTATTTASLPDGTTLSLPAHTRVILAPKRQILVGTASGLALSARPAGLQDVQRSLNRRALLEAAFGFLGTPYGFGGQGGGRDCSRFLMDLFGSFGINLPRHSAWQSKFGTSHVDLDRSLTPTQRLSALDSAHAKGAILLYFPGHIMLYLGRNQDGQPMAMHALGEYVKPCKTVSKVASETIFKVGEVTVTDLSLGGGSSRRSFLERMTRIVVLAEDDSTVTANDEACATDDSFFLVSPERPRPGQTARLVALSQTRRDGAELRVQLGEKVTVLQTKRLGGPPYGFIAEFKVPKRPQTQHILVTLAGGATTDSCTELNFNASRLPRIFAQDKTQIDAQDNTGPVWNAENVWNRDMESLWSIFIEQLFAPSHSSERADPEQADQDTDPQTWNNLHSLLRNPKRNFLFNHLGRNEDARLRLTPDCADLPYMLRAYFAWKLDLPFAFRRCTRGRERRPPTCSQLISNFEKTPETDDVVAFRKFANHALRSGVHSASGRTGPTDSATDFYPVPLTRKALAPGTIYADPYGHVMMIAQWKPQTQSSYGVLIAAEAQPDGTIGRRRFWEGSFLFDPDTRAFGAGFKKFRPLKRTQDLQGVYSRSNEQLTQGLANTPHSQQQYQLTPAAFYEHMDALINPAPLNPTARQIALIDALEESVNRRVLSVQNSVDYVKNGAAVSIEMPDGRSIFQTTGPWEDYSTPSRDMRLLIAIDTVTHFPARVAAHPERYVTEGHQTDVIALQTAMKKELRSRKFNYTRSDGSQQTLTLANLVGRKGALEVAYNPNDCIEIRWGATPSTRDFDTCARWAPDEQQIKMTQYRPWFSKRKRPTGAHP